MAKVPKGELTAAEIRMTAAEIRTLIKGHNKLVNIKVPTGLDRDGLIKFLKSKKFEIDHKNKRNQNPRLHYRNKRLLKQRQRKPRRKRRKLERLKKKQSNNRN
jgi:hypothetical protein